MAKKDDGSLDEPVRVVLPKTPSRKPADKAILTGKNAKAIIAKPVAKPQMKKNRAIVKH